MEKKVMKRKKYTYIITPVGYSFMFSSYETIVLKKPRVQTISFVIIYIFVKNGSNGIFQKVIYIHKHVLHACVRLIYCKEKKKGKKFP